MRNHLLATTIGLVSLWMPVYAHHSFTAQFDATKPVTLTGTVVKMDWINPHAWIYMDVKGADGKVATWMVETGSPNILLRRGFTKKTLETGSEIVVRGYMAKDGENKINGGSVTFPDGKRLFLGGSNPDDPGSVK